MKFTITSLFLFFCSITYSQEKTDSVRGSRFLAAAGPGITIGEFTDTHPLSLGAEFSWSNKRFGRLKHLPLKKTGFAANLGFYFFFGNGKIYSGLPYSFYDYKIFSLSPGIIYNPSSKSQIGLFAGPALNRYAKEFEAGVDVAVNGNYFFKNRWGIKSSLHWVQLSKADPIIFLMLMFSGNFK